MTWLKVGALVTLVILMSITIENATTLATYRFLFPWFPYLFPLLILPLPFPLPSLPPSLLLRKDCISLTVAFVQIHKTFSGATNSPLLLMIYLMFRATEYDSVRVSLKPSESSIKLDCMTADYWICPYRPLYIWSLEEMYGLDLSEGNDVGIVGLRQERSRPSKRHGFVPICFHLRRRLMSHCAEIPQGDNIPVVAVVNLVLK